MSQKISLPNSLNSLRKSSQPTNNQQHYPSHLFLRIQTLTTSPLMTSALTRASRCLSPSNLASCHPHPSNSNSSHSRNLKWHFRTHSSSSKPTSSLCQEHKSLLHSSLRCLLNNHRWGKLHHSSSYLKRYTITQASLTAMRHSQLSLKVKAVVKVAMSYLSHSLIDKDYDWKTCV
jgi:hypothetical protein